MRPTRPCASIAAFSSREMFSIFVRFQESAIAAPLAMSWVLLSMTVSRMRSRLARSVDPVSVASTMASASTGGFTSVAPQENSTLHVDAEPIEIRFGHAHELGRDRRAFEVLRLLEPGVFRRREHPAHFAEALLRIDQIGDRHEGGRRGEAALVFRDPVLTGEAAVEHAVRDVPRHFLRANQHAFDFRDRRSTESTIASSRRS